MNKQSPDTSATLFAKARQVMPGGISHRYRWRLPNPNYVDRAEGAYKWDVEGKRFIDYKMGATSQMMGHCHPAISQAIAEQAGRVIFAGDCNPIEIDWAQRITDMVPSAERVRFTASGTEATMLAIRVARAHTDRAKILRIDGHYHGWHDHLMKGAKAGPEAPPSLGVPPEIADLTLVCAPDRAAMEAAFAEHPDIAAVIVEASGANYGAVPMVQDILLAAREVSRSHGSLMILDEIITGFRWAPGGRQALAQVDPDMTTLAKIATGGMPGGALAGSAQVMDMLDPSVTKNGMTPGVLHQGTFNGAPIVAAAAVVMLDLLADGQAQAQADRMAHSIRAGLNDLMGKHSIPGLAYGESSTFHLYFGENDGTLNGIPAGTIRTPNPALVSGLMNALNARGVDLMSAMSAVTSAAHTDRDVDETLTAFDAAFHDLKEARIL
ncbi:aminotransferase class III-fold pyridoxal phosphate-dependent enzyme [uncultured Tateyamaria sp.]|uniref:aspartate aminotransferase family protein n=1 Tax=uncultured Tateyamaria sp. TaxID=455651 RepID=UPI002627E292|nr:aminotransferase class III-fold pyridoxal phosphate-dependent enzyme [uncultured Tateyamaria sp.]